MKKAIFISFIFISLAIIFVQVATVTLGSILDFKQKAGLKILSQPNSAQVFIDNVEEGKTPFENGNLSPKEYLVKIKGEDSFWQGRVKLTAGTLTYVNRELSKDNILSSGEILTLTKGEGVVVISTPSGADVEIDGKLTGQTPLSIDVLDGEHMFNISHPGYLSRSFKAYLPQNYSLTLNVDLALSETDLTSIVIPSVKETEEVVVKKTPTGFLRVRDQPSISGKEIARVLPGDTLILLGEDSQWDRIRLKSGEEGYVSKIYVEKKAQ